MSTSTAKAKAPRPGEYGYKKHRTRVLIERQMEKGTPVEELRHEVVPKLMKLKNLEMSAPQANTYFHSTLNEILEGTAR